MLGHKRAIIQKLISNAARGDPPEVPLLGLSGPQSLAKETDQARQIAMFAGDIARISSCVAPLRFVGRTAAETAAGTAGAGIFPLSPTPCRRAVRYVMESTRRFNRLFRACFGDTPSAVRTRSCRAPLSEAKVISEAAATPAAADRATA